MNPKIIREPIKKHEKGITHVSRHRIEQYALSCLEYASQTMNTNIYELVVDGYSDEVTTEVEYENPLNNEWDKEVHINRENENFDYINWLLYIIYACQRLLNAELEAMIESDEQESEWNERELKEDKQELKELKESENPNPYKIEHLESNIESDEFYAEVYQDEADELKDYRGSFDDVMSESMLEVLKDPVLELTNDNMSKYHEQAAYVKKRLERKCKKRFNDNDVHYTLDSILRPILNPEEQKDLEENGWMYLGCMSF